MSQKFQRHKRNEKTFEDLPPRVIIYDILNYHEIRLDSSLDEFDLFGYYKRDRRRSIWFLFQSLELRDFPGGDDNAFLSRAWGSYRTFPVLKIEKLQSLKIGEGSSRFKVFDLKGGKVLRNFLETFKRTNFYLLRRLSLVLQSRDVDLSGLISSHNRFPKLAHLEITCFNRDYLIKDWKWDVERIKSLQHTLQSLIVRLDYCVNIPDIGLRILGNDDTFSSLKKINIAYVHFSNQRTILLPNLEDVNVKDCNNLVIIPGSIVSSVSWCDIIQIDDMKELFLRSKRIKHLELFSLALFLERDNSIRLWDESTNPLEHLTSFKFDCENSNENLETFFRRIKGQLVKFEIIRNYCVKRDLLQRGFEKLEVLKIDCTLHILRPSNETKLSCDTQLKELNIRLPYGSELTDLFKRNNFSSLEVLILDGCTYDTPEHAEISSSSFPMKNLKVLKIGSDTTDVFFAEQDFENLEVLHIIDVLESPETITGNGWKRTRFEKIREVKVTYDSASNDLFKLIEFPALKKLELEHCKKITGEGWLPMQNLCEIKIEYCKRFSKEKIEEMQKKSVNVTNIYDRPGWGDVSDTFHL